MSWRWSGGAEVARAGRGAHDGQDRRGGGRAPQLGPCLVPKRFRISVL